jgi:hypothetical protein
MAGTWERILDQKPIPLIDHLVGEAAKLIAADYLRWPLEVEGGAEAAQTFGPEAQRPAPALYREALRLARWDVAHETDAFDDYMRNRRYLGAGIPESERGRLLLLGRWVVEQLLALGEHTQGRVNRARKLACADGIAREVERLLAVS